MATSATCLQRHGQRLLGRCGCTRGSDVCLGGRLRSARAATGGLVLANVVGHVVAHRRQAPHGPRTADGCHAGILWSQPFIDAVVIVTTATADPAWSAAAPALAKLEPAAAAALDDASAHWVVQPGIPAAPAAPGTVLHTAPHATAPAAVSPGHQQVGLGILRAPAGGA